MALSGYISMKYLRLASLCSTSAAKMCSNHSHPNAMVYCTTATCNVQGTRLTVHKINAAARVRWL